MSLTMIINNHFIHTVVMCNTDYFFFGFFGAAALFVHVERQLIKFIIFLVLLSQDFHLNQSFQECL